MLPKFMMPAAGMSAPKASNDPKEGGRFEIIMPAGENEILRAGTYQEISPLDWIDFTCESPFPVDHSTMTLTFELVEKGTRVTLTYVRVNDAETCDNHEGGWVNILKALNAILAT